MCTISMVGDWANNKWRKEPWYPPFVPQQPNQPQADPIKIDLGQVTKEEFEALKKEVQELKDLLTRAKEYDERTNQPNCEMEEKVALIKAVAKAVGVNLEDIF